MFKRVDTEDKDNIKGFSYLNKRGIEEAVGMGEDSVDLLWKNYNPLTNIYYEDIPNFIKALKAAYTHKTGLPL